jgi:hypothetical protein
MNPRLILAALLLTTPLLYAQDDAQEAQKIEIKLVPTKEAAQPQKEPAPPHEPFQITITFKNTNGSKTTTQRTYTLVATTDANNPEIRDDSRVPIKTSNAETQNTMINTDVDFIKFSKAADSVYLGLRISTETYAEGVSTLQADKEIMHLITHNHRCTVTPTLPIGKLTTVYSSVDGANDTKEEIQVLIQPLSAK